jgi:hypothetical protein
MSPTFWGDSRDIALTPSSHNNSYCNGKADGTLTESTEIPLNAAKVGPFALCRNNVYLGHVVRVESSRVEWNFSINTRESDSIRIYWTRFD